MASLSHVCMWSNNGWKPVSAAEAARLHPGGTVSAHSGLFMCELCGQYVTLTDGLYRVRYFKHSRKEKNKDCPERTFPSGIYPTYSESEHDLPIKLFNITNTGFELAIGFIRVPNELLASKLRIEIHPSTYNPRPYIYLKERLKTDGITYLSIGDIPSEKYEIVVSGCSRDIYKFWPKSVQGIDRNGTVFDGVTGVRMVTDADVVVGKKYYLLLKGFINSSNSSHVTIKMISRKSVWNLYEVMANDYDKESAKFFLDYHCRLTDSPITMTTVWPVSVEDPYIVKHSQKSIIMHLSGNITTNRVFPKANVDITKCNNGSVLEIFCNSRQQLISAGRARALQYTYFWKEPLKQTTEEQVATVTDIKRNAYSEGLYSEIPDDNTLRIQIPYDGLLNVRIKGRIVEKRKISANIPTEISGIVWNMDLEVLIGLDCVWQASFQKKQSINFDYDDTALLQKLCSYTGPQIRVSHVLGSMASVLVEYPNVRKWLYKCIRSGYMNERAYRELQRLFLNQ